MSITDNFEIVVLIKIFINADYLDCLQKTIFLPKDFDFQ